MFLAIKCMHLKVLRTVPKKWTINIAKNLYCWIPTSDYALKFANEAVPTAQDDIELHECEILFDKEFQSFTECEMALSQLDLGPEWVFESIEKVASSNVIAKLGDSSNNEHSADTTQENDENAGPVLAENIPVGCNEEVNTTSALLPAASEVVSEGVIAFTRPLTEEDRYEENKRLCMLNHFKPPIHYKEFNKLNFRYTRNLSDNDLVGDNRFLTDGELGAIPRKIKKPFCHPGPELKDELYHWYLVDSIVQKVQLKGDTFPSFVVRWVGYEDQYNTVEPFPNIKHTAVHKLFENPLIKTACRSNNSRVKKSRTEILRGEQMINEAMPIMHNHACLQLISQLKNEESAGRYSDAIGFYSNESAAMALKRQHKFIFNIFLPLINGLCSTVYVDKHYIGATLGNLQGAAEFKNVVEWETKNLTSIKDYINRGLRIAKSAQAVGPHFVCFFVPRKFDTDENKDENHLSLHMCAFIVRSNGGLKDDKDDCLFQVMLYLMKLATGEVSFEPNDLKKCRRVDRHTENRIKKMKFA